MSLSKESNMILTRQGDNSTDTFKSNIILVVNQVGITYTGKRERRMISMNILKEKYSVGKNNNSECSDLKPFLIHSLHYFSYIARSLLTSHFIPRIFFCKYILNIFPFFFNVKRQSCLAVLTLKT